MVEARAMASVNLHAVLRVLEDLVERDLVAADLIRAARTRVTFVVPGLPKLSLTFTDGVCTASASPTRLPPDHDDIVLAFTSPSHFSKLMDGTGTPIPLKGLRRIGFLKGEFTALTDRLESVLRPTPEALADPEFARLSTTLTAYVAFFALAQIGNLDPLGKANAARIADGTINVEIIDGPAVSIEASGGHLTVRKGAAEHARAVMTFDSLDSAGGVLTGTLDSYAALGDGRLAIRGYVPMLDNMNKLLVLVARYLA